MRASLTIISLLLPIIGYFFWGRGLVRSSKGDIVLGFCIFALMFVIAVVCSDTSAVFFGLGVLLFFFGVETLVIGTFTRPDCPISRKDRITLGVVAVVLGVFGSLIV